MNQKSSSPARTPYEPPKVFRIRIAGDELAVAGCKSSTVGVGGPTAGPASSCFKAMCLANGS